MKVFCSSFVFTDHQSDVKDKPELLIVAQVSLYPNETYFDRTFDICRIGKRDSEAKLSAGPFDLEKTYFINTKNLDFNYDPEENAIYKLHDNERDIEKVRLNEKIKSYVYKSPNFSEDDTITSIGLDSKTKNLYFISTLTSELKVLNLNESSATPKTLFDFKSRYNSLMYLTTVKVFSNENYLVFLVNSKFVKF